jgi:hypothetical protein
MSKIKKELEQRLTHSTIICEGDHLAITYIHDSDEEDATFHIEGRTDDYEGWEEFSVKWDEEKQTFEAVDPDRDITFKVPTIENVNAMKKALAEVEKKVTATQKVFKDLGFEKEMVFIHEDTDMIDWNSSKC